MQETVGGVTTSLESYSYLGRGTIVNMGHSQTGVNLTYIDPLGLPGDGGDKYAGLDRFGRVIDQRWYKASTATDVDRFQHTYDRNSNRLTRDVTATGAPTTLDEAYSYDNLNRLTKVNQGTLAANTITDALATYSKSWNLDALGNWKTMVEDLDGGGSGTATTQTRTANARNQISSITGLTTRTYDAKGNMTAEETGQKLVYDGWDRLTKVQDSASQSKVSYTYDGLGRRIKRTDHGANLSSTADDVTTNIYYGGAADWQVLEERIGSTVKNQYVWSPKYIDAMVLRDRDATTGGDLGKTGSGLDERLYPTHDTNFNVTAILDIAGAVVERFRSDPYGNNLIIMNAAWQTVTEMKDWQHFFQGGRRDGISDLYHFRNREYDPVLAVWTRMDPLGDVDGMNLYQMEGSNPAYWLDPSGLLTCAERDQLLWLYSNEYSRLSSLGNPRDNLPMMQTLAALIHQYRSTPCGDTAPYDPGISALRGALDGFFAWINGFIPFVDPVEQHLFGDPCDPVLRVSENLGRLSRDVWLLALIPNLSTWLRNPAAYEAGSMTMPNHVFQALSHLSVVERGRRRIAELGYLRAFIPTAELNAYRETVLRWTGLTPLGWLAILSAFETLDSTFDQNCSCEGQN